MNTELSSRLSFSLCVYECVSLCKSKLRTIPYYSIWFNLTIHCESARSQNLVHCIIFEVNGEFTKNCDCPLMMYMYVESHLYEHCQRWTCNNMLATQPSVIQSDKKSEKVDDIVVAPTVTSFKNVFKLFVLHQIYILWWFRFSFNELDSRNKWMIYL